MRNEFTCGEHRAADTAGNGLSINARSLSARTPAWRSSTRTRASRAARRAAHVHGIAYRQRARTAVSSFVRCAPAAVSASGSCGRSATHRS